ncbi:hypothetical protein TGRUB_272300 [Toxoplasma gondii RUB]|uniref:Uncharacterized protein n=2 Tax=Toxoplasma gondii TaxID=5811 RepID=A0A086M5G7_TOXGO|nr:hypothetical protein TGRUB_272300 [Toxoplasma gondii RUB]KFH16967.1 hypothetical protein TGMAS_272300 [Toxoplasma gondii MAS]
MKVCMLRLRMPPAYFNGAFCSSVCAEKSTQPTSACLCFVFFVYSTPGDRFRFLNVSPSTHMLLNLEELFVFSQQAPGSRKSVALHSPSIERAATRNLERYCGSGQSRRKGTFKVVSSEKTSKEGSVSFHSTSACTCACFFITAVEGIFFQKRGTRVKGELHCLAAHRTMASRLEKNLLFVGRH